MQASTSGRQSSGFLSGVRVPSGLPNCTKVKFMGKLREKTGYMSVST